MSYSQFTIAKVIEEFDLSLIESQDLLPDILEVSLSPYLQEFINNPIDTVYGAVITGTVWRFLKLNQSTLTLDLNEYPLPPLEDIISRLVQMIRSISSTSRH